MKTLLLLLLTAALQAAEKPNIILIMVDDMGFSDIGCYGAEIDTPHLDALSQKGLRFAQFYNAGRCCPTRASLLTGLYQHQPGIGHMSDDRGHPSYRGRLNRRCLTIAEALKPAGYFTAMTGKWHVGSDRKSWPRQRGFDRFYGTPQGGGHHYRNLPNRSLVLNDDEIPMPDQWYSTTAFTDHALTFLDEGLAKKQPVFLYLAYTAPHWPLQAPAETIAKFRDHYAKGWQPVRQARFQRQLEMGLFPPHTKLAPQDQKIPAWSAVKDKEEMILRMATHAAMIHLVDQAIGRLVTRLRQQNQLDNTLIVFLSDNGASAESGPTGFTGSRGGDPKARTGTADSYNSYGIAGANLSDTPFREYKMFVHEGGIATPLIAHWPDGISKKLKGTFTREPGHIIDLLPTFLDLAGATYPAEKNGITLYPLEGLTLRPALTGKPLNRPAPLFFEHQGNSAVRDGDWKLVRKHNQPWSLHNLKTDPTELKNLAQKHPEKVTLLKQKYQTWATKTQVLPWPLRLKK